MNVCIFRGRLARDPELSYTKNNVPLCKFSIAVESWRKDENGKKLSHFFNCDAWKKTAENISQYFRKGDEIMIQAEAHLDQWEDRQSGQKRSAVKFIVQNFWFGQKSRANQGRNDGGPMNQEIPRGEPEGWPESNDSALGERHANNYDLDEVPF